MRKILFHKYEVLNTLGIGGSGEVVLAKDLHLNQLVAIKSTKDYSAVAERELLKKMEHPGLPKIYDFFEENEKRYLVMEYIEGISLKQYMEKHGKVAYLQAVEWGMQIAKILQYLHGHRPAIIYRDLKPGNIMIRPDGSLKLIDMGAALRNSYGQKSDEMFQCAGTPGYNPPEQWKNKKVDCTVDIYSLGAVLHEMLTGVNPAKPPYERRPIREYDKSIPGGLNKVIQKCTAKRSADRYQTMEQLENALLNYHKIGRGEQMMWAIRKIIVAIPIIAGVFSLLYPLATGIPETQFPLPYLQIPMICFCVALGLQIVLFELHKKKHFLKHQEKNIWLTEKQFSGLYIFLLMILGSIGLGIISQTPPGTAYAGAIEKKLWVELRGDDNRKILLKNDAVYQAEDFVRLEIPTGELPPGEIAIQLIAVKRNGEIYTSRIFNVESTRKE